MKKIISSIFVGVLIIVGSASLAMAKSVNASNANISHGLRLGASDNENDNSVATLQATLAADPSVYPEGLVTGRFGPLTAKAVKKLQEKSGLEQVGSVGPKTLAVLSQWLAAHPLGLEQDNTSNTKRPCAIVPPGHLIAPGWLRKQGGVKPIVPACQTLPFGILLKLGLATSTTGTSTPPDITPPVISGVMATSTTASTTLITWQTNELANSQVWYATSTPVTTASTTPSVNMAALVLNHSLTLTNLTASSTYYYLVGSTDASGNLATSSQNNFSTQ